MLDNIVNRVLDHPKIVELREQLTEILALAREINEHRKSTDRQA